MKLRYMPISVVAAVSLAACGSTTAHSDSPTASPTTSVSGALTGDNVDGLRVALLWRAADSKVHVQGDVAIVDGKFEVPLASPSAGDMVGVDANDPCIAQYDPGFNQTDSAVVSATTATPAAAALTLARAAFVVYRDLNGNGAFDVDPVTSVTTDTIVGGERNLLLTYYAGGSAFDYEKVGGHAGFNLAWQGTAVDLAQVQLQIATAVDFPAEVCGGVESNFRSSIDATGGPPYRSYPAKDDTALQCAADGYSFTDANWTAVKCAAIPSGICLQGAEGLSTCNPAPDPHHAELTPGSALPAGWPCTVTGP